MRTRHDLIVALLACSGCAIADAQSFLYTAQERSVYYRIGTTSQSLSAPNFNAWNASVSTGGVGSNRAYSNHFSDLGATTLEFRGEVWTSSGGPNQAKGVFDVTFVLTAATQVRLNYFMSEWWNLTLWTPSGSQVLSVADGFAYFDDRTLSLNAGTYRIRADSDVSNGKAGNALVEFQIVPAPGSLGVLGVVGVLGARRRR
ncbi:MAG: hypothetical protein SFY96_11695 [Planctomycetota bacterium]|nr:hypothetical protein [Planctomycetota bacterium]